MKKANFASYLFEKKYGKNIPEKANKIISFLEKRYGKIKLVPDDHYYNVFKLEQDAPNLFNYMQVFFQGPDAHSYDETLTEGFVVTDESANNWYLSPASYDKSAIIKAIESCAKEEKLPVS